MASKIRRSIKSIAFMAIVYGLYLWMVEPIRIASHLSSPTSSGGHVHSYTHSSKSLRPAHTGQPRGRWCTNEDLVRHYRENNSLPSDGFWDKANKFHPKLCDFNTKAMSPAAFRECFKRKKVRQLMMIGDSNTMRALRAAQKLSRRTFSSCKITRKENMLNDETYPEPAYFSLGNKKMEAALVPTSRGCRKCYSSTFQCMSKQEKFTIDHVGMGMIWDQSLAFKSYNKKFSGDSFQEIVLKYYISAVKPDLVLLYPPFNHLRSDNYTQAQQAMAKTYSHVKHYLPNTPVVWMPGFAEFEQTKSKKDRNRLYSGVLAADIIERYNKDMFKMLKTDLIDGTGKTMSFFDLVPISRSRLKWSKDGQHMADIWYDTIFDYWLQTYCGV